MFEKAVKQATEHVLKSRKARTYHESPLEGSREYTLEIQMNDEGDLEVATWGFDYQIIRVPQTRGQLIASKCRLQMMDHRDGVATVALRYCLDILAREAVLEFRS